MRAYRTGSFMAIIYTLGVGRTTEVEFISRLQVIEKRLRRSLWLVDIRRYNSRSRNGKWCWQAGDREDFGLVKTIALLPEQVGAVTYSREPGLANHGSGNVVGLEQYRQKLLFARGEPLSATSIAISRVLYYLRKHSDKAFILLCTERAAFKYRLSKGSRKVLSSKPNCHRIILADELVNTLYRRWDQEWSIEHL